MSVEDDFPADSIVEITAAQMDSHWVLFLGKQLVSYQEYDATTDDWTTIHTNIQALTEGESKKEVDTGDGNFVFRTVRNFNLRVSTMPGVNVTKRGKIIEADGTVWIVGEVFKLTFKTRWKCPDCYKLSG